MVSLLVGWSVHPSFADCQEREVEKDDGKGQKEKEGEEKRQKKRGSRFSEMIDRSKWFDKKNAFTKEFTSINSCTQTLSSSKQ